MCLQPIKLKDQPYPVPCGKCPECRARRISGWSFRLTEQQKVSNSSWFITLTYDTDNVPITKSGFMDLQKRDLQLFFKRLRKAHEEQLRVLQTGIGIPISRLSLKYYACGEYGGRTRRPHYHIILFNASIELIQTAWDKGQVHYGQVTGASIGYTLKYISKPSKIPQHRNDDRTKEFSLMSKLLA